MRRPLQGLLCLDGDVASPQGLELRAGDAQGLRQGLEHWSTGRSSSDEETSCEVLPDPCLSQSPIPTSGLAFGCCTLQPHGLPPCEKVPRTGFTAEDDLLEQGVQLHEDWLRCV